VIEIFIEIVIEIGRRGSTLQKIVIEIITVSTAKMYWLNYIMHSRARQIFISSTHFPKQNRFGLYRFSAQWNRLH